MTYKLKIKIQILAYTKAKSGKASKYNEKGTANMHWDRVNEGVISVRCLQLQETDLNHTTYFIT